MPGVPTIGITSADAFAHPPVIGKRGSGAMPAGARRGERRRDRRARITLYSSFTDVAYHARESGAAAGVTKPNLDRLLHFVALLC